MPTLAATHPQPKPWPIHQAAVVLISSGKSGDGVEVGGEPLVDGSLGQCANLIGDQPSSPSGAETAVNDQSEEEGINNEPLGHSQPVCRSRLAKGRV